MDRHGIEPKESKDDQEFHALLRRFNELERTFDTRVRRAIVNNWASEPPPPPINIAGALSDIARCIDSGLQIPPVDISVLLSSIAQGLANSDQYCHAMVDRILGDQNFLNRLRDLVRDQLPRGR